MHGHYPALSDTDAFCIAFNSVRAEERAMIRQTVGQRASRRKYRDGVVQSTGPFNLESPLQLILSAEKADKIRRFGIYVGPVILASVVGNAVYGAVFGTTTINIGGLPFFMNVVFAVIGGVVAWSTIDTLGRIAWMVFALHHGVQALAGILGFRIGSGWSLGLITLFAVLATGSGVPKASRRTLLIAGGVFVIATIAVFTARYYADELLGRHRVIR